MRPSLILAAVAVPSFLYAQTAPVPDPFRPVPPSPSWSASDAAHKTSQSDPLYATMFGGSGLDHMWDHVVTDDFMCFVGTTSSTDILTFNPIQDSLRGPFDGFIGCSTISSQLPVLLTYFGGDSTEGIFAADVYQDTLYVLGSSNSDALPGTDGSYQADKGGLTDCFITRLSIPDGGGLSTTYFGGEGTEGCSDIIAGPYGVWIAGSTDGAVDLVDPILADRRGSSDGFFSYLDLDLAHLDYSTLFGSDGADGLTTVDAVPAPPDTVSGKNLDGRPTLFQIIYAGWADGDGLPTSDNAFQQGRAGAVDIVLGYFHHDTEDESTQWVFGSYFGGDGFEAPEASAATRDFIVFGGWTTSAGIPTITRPANGGVLDGFGLGSHLPLGEHDPVFGYAGPSETYNQVSALDASKLGTISVGGFTDVPDQGRAFTQVYNVSGILLQTEFIGLTNSFADCLTTRTDYSHVSCGGRTTAGVFATPGAFQRDYGGGEYDMFGSIFLNEFSYTNVFNRTDRLVEGTYEQRPIKPISPGSMGRLQHASWGREQPYQYLLSGDQFTRIIEFQPQGENERLGVHYLFDDRTETFFPPIVPPKSDMIGIFALNELGVSVDAIITDQTPLHNEISRTTFDPGQPIILNLEKGQNLRIDDGSTFTDWTPNRRFFKGPLPNYSGFLTESQAAAGKAQELELVLFSATGALVVLPVTTGIGEIPKPDLEILGLSGYPNPFAATATIRYLLDRHAQVKLTVFDVLGRRIRALVDSEQTGGSHEINWDGLDDAGRPAASGTYILRLETRDRVLGRSIVLAR